MKMKIKVMNEEDVTQTNYTPPHLQYIRIAVAVFLLLLIIFTLIFAYTNNSKIRIDDIPTPVGQETPKFNPFESTTVTARSAIVWNTENNEVIFAKNENESLPLASITKVASALTASEQTSEDTVVNITLEDLMEEGDTGLTLNEKWNLRDLLNLTLVSSSNDGAKAVANVISASHQNNDYFVEKMNDTAYNLGLTQTKFYNENGLDIDNQRSGGYGSALDVARLLDYIMKNKPELLEATRYSRLQATSLNGDTKVFKNTNSDLKSTPGLLASKTGYTDLAGGNLAVVVEPGMAGPFVIVVLGSNYDGRFSDIERLTKDLLVYLEETH